MPDIVQQYINSQNQVLWTLYSDGTVSHNNISNVMAALWGPTVYFPDGLNVGAAGFTPNLVIGTQIFVPGQITIHKVNVINNVAVAGKHWGVGIYSLDGSKQYVAATFPTDATGLLTVTINPNVVLSPGGYIYVVTTDSAATGCDFARSSTGANYAAAALSAANPSVAGVLPATLGVLTPGAGPAFPTIALFT